KEEAIDMKKTHCSNNNKMCKYNNMNNHMSTNKNNNQIFEESKQNVNKPIYNLKSLGNNTFKNDEKYNENDYKNNHDDDKKKYTDDSNEENIYEERNQKILLIHLLKNIKELLNRQRQNFNNFLSFLSENYQSYEKFYKSQKYQNGKNYIDKLDQQGELKNVSVVTHSFLDMSKAANGKKDKNGVFVKLMNDQKKKWG
ncbi:hypothetical protein PFNF54_01837, partial [Plasmodium falciparum NF54]